MGHGLRFSSRMDGKTSGPHRALWCSDGPLCSLFNDSIGNEVNAKGLDLLVVFVVPEAALNLTNMSRAEEEHHKTRNTDTSPVRVGKFFVNDGPLKAQFSFVHHVAVRELLQQGILVDTDAHATEFVAITSNWIQHDDI